MKKKALVLLAVVAMIWGSACGDDKNDDEKATAGANSTVTTEKKSDEGNAVSISMKEYGFSVPASVTGGFVDLSVKNDGKLKHEAAFIKVDTDPGQAQFVKDMKQVVQGEGTPIPAYLHAYAGATETKAGETTKVSQALPAGTYYLVCNLTDADSTENGGGGPESQKLPLHFEQGMIQKVTVTGAATATLPTKSAVVAAKEYTFDVSGIKAGENDVLFRNDGPQQIHMGVVVEFPEGVDEAAAGKALQAFGGEGPPPAGTPEPKDIANAGVFDPGGGSTFKLNAQAGRVYGFLCFIQDRTGGPPHIAKGMAKLFTVK